MLFYQKHKRLWVQAGHSNQNLISKQQLKVKTRSSKNVKEMANKNNFNIELLNGNNYAACKFRIKILLEEKGVGIWVENEFTPSAYTDDSKREQDKKKDKLCQSIIVQCLDDSQLDFIRDKENAFEMWEALRNRYEKEGLPGQIFLKKRMLSLQLKESSSNL